MIKLLLILSLSVHSLVFAKKTNPLVNETGQLITNISEWNTQREKIKEILQAQMYGFRPKALENTFHLVKKTILYSTIDYREYIIGFKEKKITKSIRVSLFSPLNKMPSGIFMTLNRCGNHTLLPHEAIAFDSTISVHPSCYKDGNLERGSRESKTSVRQIIERGYALATIAEGSIDSDDPSLVNDGIMLDIHLLNPNIKENQRPGHLMAWSWGLSQIINLVKSNFIPYLNNVPLIAIGHSRRGKAALLTGAFDERVDITIAHQSGMGGTARIRGATVPIRESANFMFSKNSAIYHFTGDKLGLGHFFSETFEELSKKPNQLDFDAHFLTSLVAPRFLLDVQGSKDSWAGPKASWKTLEKTFPTYQLYRKETATGALVLDDNHIPEIFPIMQIKKETKHIIDDDYWTLFLNYADMAISQL